MIDRNNKPNAVDIAVGARIKLERHAQKMSQSKLADEIGLTFQQVQKYESGANRISVGRLAEIATVLNVPIEQLILDGVELSKIDRTVANISQHRGAFELMSMWRRLSTEKRRAVLKLIHAML